MAKHTHPDHKKSNRTIAKLRSLKNFIPFLSRISKLEDELSLLTSNSSDTVYRLRYNSMSYDYVSPAIATLLGFSPEEMKNINYTQEDFITVSENNIDALLDENELINDDDEDDDDYCNNENLGFSV